MEIKALVEADKRVNSNGEVLALKETVILFEEDVLLKECLPL